MGLIGAYRRRRHKRYGWAAKVGDFSARRVPVSLWERALDSNCFWLVCVIALVVVVIFMARIPERMGIRFSSPPPAPQMEMSSKDDEVHRSFLGELDGAERYSSLIETRFDAPQEIRIVFPGTVGDDEIYYLSKLVAYKAYKDIGAPCTVRAYLRAASGTQDTLVATTNWEPEKYGFVVDFHRATDL